MFQDKCNHAGFAENTGDEAKEAGPVEAPQQSAAVLTVQVRKGQAVPFGLPRACP